MAAYDVKREEKKQEEPNPVMVINVVPAIIWSVVVCQRFASGLAFWPQFAIGVAFVVAYMVLGMLPYVSLITNIASTIMLVGMIWALVDHIGNDVGRVVVKVIMAAWIGLMELGVCAMVNGRKY